MDAETLARKRWRPVAKLLERREKIGRQAAEQRVHAAVLRDKLPGAEQRDREQRARAIIDGGREPGGPGEKERLEVELASTEQHVQDLQAAAELIAQELEEARQGNHDTWAKGQAQQVERAKTAMAEAATKLEHAASRFEDELVLQTWVAEQVGPTVDPLGGRFTHTGTLAAALAQLRAAVDGLAAGTAPQPPAGREPGPVEKRLAAKAKPQWG